MAQTRLKAPRIAGISTSVPDRTFDNSRDSHEFPPEDVRKVVAMAGVSSRHVADETTCSSDLCIDAARRLLQRLDWEVDSVDGLIFVTQTPDYFLPSSSCVAHEKLGLSDTCAAFDLGLGCSGYPYGLWTAAMMMASGSFGRILLLHGETPSRFADKSDRSVALLFGDAGSATAIEAAGERSFEDWAFVLQTDGTGFSDLIIEGGGFRDRFCTLTRNHYVKMNGANIFNFTIKRVPPLIEDTLELARLARDEIDYYVFHQSNQFIMKHLAQKLGLPMEKVPLILKEYGNTGGPSVPLAITRGALQRPAGSNLRLLLVGYGVGLSWGSALVQLDPEALLLHGELKLN